MLYIYIYPSHQAKTLVFNSQKLIVLSSLIKKKNEKNAFHLGKNV